MSVQIIVDSACDITPEEIKALGITMIPLHTYFGEKEYLDGVELSHDRFFELLTSQEDFPTTSQISPYEYEQYFEKVKENGDTAVYLSLSSKLSGCYQSACIAASDYEGSIFVVDSENACIGQRILTELAAQLAKDGKSAEEIASVLNTKKKDVRLWAVIDTLEYLKKGGRISSVAAFAGTLLSIKPLISVVDGNVEVIGKARGNKAGNVKLSELVTANPIDFDLPYCLAYSGLSDELLQKYIEDYKDLYEGKTTNLPISSIGCAIGTHIGPGAIGVAYFTK